MSSARRPNTSDHAPAGSFTSTPVSAEAATMAPIKRASAPSWRAKSGSRGERHIA
jgi:hypothetical protein